MTAPLQDVTVVEVTNYVAAPSASVILADLGADVIRVEPLHGDPWRGQGRRVKLDSDLESEEALRFDYQHTVTNRGKRSIAVDLRTEEGQALVRRLVASADIFVCNLLAERQERFGLDPKTLAEHNPRLVHATLTGYGTTGPEAWRPGYDVTAFFGRSGLSSASREGPDGVVPGPRPAQGDHTTGLAFFGAIMAALRLAEKTGEGQVVETSLFEAAVWTQACDYAITAVDRAPLRPRPREAMVLATNNRYPCGDGKWLVVTMPEESAWPKWCKVLGREDWLADERFQTIRGRFRNMAEIVAGVDEVLAAKSRDEWGEIFDREGIVWGPVLDLHEVVEDPQAEAIGLFPEIDDPVIGPMPTVRIPMRFHTAEVGPQGPAPDIGQHTADILSGLGLTGEEIEQLAQAGVVSG